MSLTDELARQRNRHAADRTLLAWIRTCLALISFGFGLETIVATLRHRGPGDSATNLGVSLVAVSVVVTGMVTMAAATAEHQRQGRRLLHDDYRYREEPSLAVYTALALTAIGGLALVLMLLRTVRG